MKIRPILATNVAAGLDALFVGPPQHTESPQQALPPISSTTLKLFKNHNQMEPLRQIRATAASKTPPFADNHSGRTKF